MIKNILAAGVSGLVLTALAPWAFAQQAPPAPRPYYVGNQLGNPPAPPAPDAQNPLAYVAASDNVKAFGALVATESCSYDPVRDLIVAPGRGVANNIQLNNGFIAFINHDGSIHTPRWVGVQNPGAQRDTMIPPLVLNEPFGSDIVNGILYLADRDGGVPDAANPGQNTPFTAVIRAFNMETGLAEGNEIRVDGVAFNDIEVAEDGTIYASVSGNMGMVYKITPDGTASVFIPNGEPLNSPNGVAFDPDGNIVIVNINDDGVLTYAPDGTLVKTEHASQPGSDGLVIMPDGTKFVSSVQQGGISMIKADGTSELIATGIPSAASMCYDAGANQLVVPMNANNGLAFVSLEGIYTP